MVWWQKILLALIATGAGVALLLLVLRNLSITFSSPGGFTTISSASAPAWREVDEAQMDKVLARMLKGDLFDSLWVNDTKDEYSGVILTLSGGKVELSASFSDQREKAKREAFEKAMAPFGFPVDRSSGYNGGMDPEHATTMLDYTLPADAGRIKAVLAVALPPGKRYVVGYRSSIPSRSGVQLEWKRDPLDQVL